MDQIERRTELVYEGDVKHLTVNGFYKSGTSKSLLVGPEEFDNCHVKVLTDYSTYLDEDLEDPLVLSNVVVEVNGKTVRTARLDNMKEEDGNLVINLICLEDILD